MTLKRNFSEFTTEFLNAWKDDPASFMEALFVYVQLLWVTCFPFFGKISQESWRLSFLVHREKVLRDFEFKKLHLF